MAEGDRRTLPPAARPWAIGFLVATALYLLVGLRVALGDLGYAPPLLPPRPDEWFWAAQFHMFNEPRPVANVVTGTIDTPTGPVALDLPALYPTLREEGPSYARSRFLSDPRRLAALAADVCSRQAGTRVRLTLTKVPKLGGDPQTVALGEWPCR